MGPELVRFGDRRDHLHVLAMTHEEAVAALMATEVKSYRQLPLMVYQIQLKYRDEPRPRGGLIRTREFTMKDAYSLHMDSADVEAYYERMAGAYFRIFERVGLGDVARVISDTGVMGGTRADEFQLLCDTGEDTLLVCPSCSYRANVDVATTVLDQHLDPEEPLELVETPDCTTIEEVATYLDVPVHRTGKALFYATPDGTVALVLIRGDRQVNEVRLASLLGVSRIEPATGEQIARLGAVPGYASALGVEPGPGLRVLIDESIATASNLVVGANRAGYHYRNFNLSRDLEIGEGVDLIAVEEGDGCPMCGAAMESRRGIEVGNIFQLGTRYCESYGVEVLDSQGRKTVPFMCSYGIGVGRLVAGIAEEHHDEQGLVWPAAVAPFDIHVIALGGASARKAAAEVYDALQARKIEAILDDRKESAGVKFTDADLMGMPHQLIISDRGLKEGRMELKVRATGERQDIPAGGSADAMADEIAARIASPG